MSRGTNGGGAPRKTSLMLLALVFLAGVAFAGLFSAGLHATDSVEFCTSCHTMQINLREYKKTIHYKNAAGVQATCSDCHVPKEFIPKMITKILAVKDLYHEILGTISTPEKFEAHRWEMANDVWARMKADDSLTCRNCHSFAHMDLSAQGRSARKRHGRAADEGKTCIDCHKGIAHTEPDEPDDS